MAKPQYKMPTQQKSKVFPIVISVIILAMVGIVALTVMSNKTPDGKKGKIEVSPNASVAASTVGGVTGPTSLSELNSDDAADPEQGTIMPTLTAKDFQNNEVTLSPNGKPYVVAFVAHWCVHCQREVPLIVNLYKDGKLPKNVDFIAVATGTDSTRNNYPPSAWLSKEGWPWQTLADDQAGTLNTTFGSPGFPYVIYVNADGTIQARTTGEQDEATIIANAQAVSESKSSTSTTSSTIAANTTP